VRSPNRKTGNIRYGIFIIWNTGIGIPGTVTCFSTFAILAYVQQREQPTGAITWSAEGGSTGIYRFADIDAQYGDLFALFGFSGIGEILSAIGYTIPPGATDLVIAAFKEPEKTVIKVAATVKGEEITEEIAFYCIRLEITKPNLLRTGAPPVYFETTPPYRYNNQGVTSVSPGPYNLPFARNCAPADFVFKWGLAAAPDTPGAGTLQDDVKDDPKHAAPASAGKGTLNLKPLWKKRDGTTLELSGSDFVDARQIVIFQDHLARDTANFQQGRQCSPAIELADGVIVEGASLACKDAACHAYNGSRSGAPWDSSGWTSITFELPFDYEILSILSGTLSRGDVISYGPQPVATGHWETCLDDGGNTYAADTSRPGDPASGKFLRDQILDYRDRHPEMELNYVKFWYRP